MVFVPWRSRSPALGFSLVRQMRPAAKYTRTTCALSAVLFLFCYCIGGAEFFNQQETAFAQDSLVCFRAGMMFAIPTAFCLRIVLRRGAALSPALTGATAGGLAGLAGLAVLEIHCPNMNVYHIVVAHVSVVVVCVLAGFSFFQRDFKTPDVESLTRVAADPDTHEKKLKRRVSNESFEKFPGTRRRPSPGLLGGTVARAATVANTSGAGLPRVPPSAPSPGSPRPTRLKSTLVRA